jgi:hypothetical protein
MVMEERVLPPSSEKKIELECSPQNVGNDLPDYMASYPRRQ